MTVNLIIDDTITREDVLYKISEIEGRGHKVNVVEIPASEKNIINISNEPFILGKSHTCPNFDNFLYRNYFL